MSGIVLPIINLSRIKNKVQDGRFKSNKIQQFALKRISHIEEAHEAINRIFQEFQEGNLASKNLILDQIGEISHMCNEGFPISNKVNEIQELKVLFSPIREEYQKFRDLLTKEESAKEEAEQLFFSNCGAKKSQLLRNEQEEYKKNPLFQAFLEKIDKKFKGTRKTIYFAYAWPTDSRYEEESWVQPFLKNLQDHLKKAGFPIVQLDIVSNRYGANIYEFMKGSETSGYVLLFGTESLLDTFSKGISTVCTELIHILRKREKDGKESVNHVFPILLSGEHRSAFPPEYERFSTIRDWRDHSYFHNFQQLFLELLGLPPEDYQSKLEKYWEDIFPPEAPSISDWYQQQREAIDTCRRNIDREGLLAIKVSRNLPLSGDEAPAQYTFIERLKDHYTTRSTITILTFREKGKWELTLPIESLYTKLAMITEKERDERRDLSKLHDGRLPTHETIFKAKKEVATDEIFKLAKGKRAVIYGSAGIGKSTFTTMLLYKWAGGELFTEFQIVFCIRLRNLTKNFYPKNRDYGAADILKQEYRSLGLDHIENDPQTTLLILDGWDELPPETREGGHLARAFQELQEDYPNLLITSRPGVIDVDATEFEILGFSDIQIGVYIDRFFHIDASKATGIKRFIQQNPLARSLAHIPINLSILCALYDEDDTLFNSNTSLTISALYDRIINQFYKIFLLRSGASQNEVRSSFFLSMHPKVQPLASCLEEIAYNASLKEEIYTDERAIAQIVYRKRLEIEDVRKLGLYRVENHQGSFIHLTFQEYFAALHISRLYESPEISSQAREIVRKIKFNGKFVRILSMVAGVLSNSENQKALQLYFDDLHSEPRDLAEIYELTLLARCFEECECPDKLSQYGDFIKKVKEWIKSFPLEYLITTLFQGNQKLLFHHDIVVLFDELLSHEHSQQYLLSILKEITTHSAKLPPEIFQKFEKCLYERVGQEDIISILGNIGGKRAIKLLISILENPKVFENLCFLAGSELKRAVSTGERIGKKGIEDLISLVAEPKVIPDVRRSAALAIGKMASSGEEIGEERIITLTSLVEDPEVSQYLRWSSAFTLGEIALSGERIGEKGVEALITLVADREVDQNVRLSAASALGEVVSGGEEIGKKGVKDLVSLVTDTKGDQNVRMSAASAIGEVATSGEEIGEKRIIMLTSLVADPNAPQKVRSSVAEALGKMGLVGEELRDKRVEVLISLVADPQVGDGARFSAALVLGKIASSREGLGEKGIETLVSFVVDSKVDQNVRMSAASALGKIASSREGLGEKGVKALISLVTDPQVGQYVRKSAASTLGKIVLSEVCIGEKEVKTLVSLVTDPKVDQDVRMSAASVLGEVVREEEGIKKRAVEDLISLVLDFEISRDVRESAAFALGKMINTSGEGLEERAVENLISLVLNIEVPLDVRRPTIFAFGELALLGKNVGEKGVEALVTLVADPDVSQETRSSATYALCLIATLGVKIGGVEVLISLVTDPQVDEYICTLATYALCRAALSGESIGEKGIEILISHFADPEVDKYVFDSIVEAIGKIVTSGERVGAKGVKVLISLLADPSILPDVSFYASGLLGEIASSGKRIGEKGVNLLLSLVASPRDVRYVRSSVAEALGKIVSSGEGLGENGVETLISLFANPKVDQDVRMSAAKALVDISPDDIIKYYPGNVEFFKLYCQVNQRGLTRKKEEWIITDQIK